MNELNFWRVRGSKCGRGGSFAFYTYNAYLLIVGLFLNLTLLFQFNSSLWLLLFACFQI